MKERKKKKKKRKRKKKKEEKKKRKKRKKEKKKKRKKRKKRDLKNIYKIEKLIGEESKVNIFGSLATLARMLPTIFKKRPQYANDEYLTKLVHQSK